MSGTETAITTTAGFVERVVRAALAMPKDKPCGCEWYGRSRPLEMGECQRCDSNRTIPNDQRALLLEAFGRKCPCDNASDFQGRCAACRKSILAAGPNHGKFCRDCHGTGYVPRDFSALDDPNLTQARTGLARSVCEAMGWTGDAKLEIEIWADGKAHAIVGPLEDWVAAATKDAAAFAATVKALEASK